MVFLKHRYQQMWPFSEMSLAQASFWGNISNWVLLGCLLGGVLATFVVVQTTNVKEQHWDALRDQAGIEIEQLGYQADIAKADLEKAKTESALANERAAQATARALEAQLALEQLKAPRTLDIERHNRIFERIKHFAGTPFDLALQPDPEAVALTLQMLTILEGAGWKLQKWHGQSGIVFNLPNGAKAGILFVDSVHVEFSENKPEWEAPVLALINALIDEGIAVKGTRATNSDDNAIHVIIGRKPM